MQCRDLGFGPGAGGGIVASTRARSDSACPADSSGRRRHRREAMVVRAWRARRRSGAPPRLLVAIARKGSARSSAARLSRRCWISQRPGERRVARAGNLRSSCARSRPPAGAQERVVPIACGGRPTSQAPGTTAWRRSGRAAPGRARLPSAGERRRASGSGGRDRRRRARGRGSARKRGSSLPRASSAAARPAIPAPRVRTQAGKEGDGRSAWRLLPTAARGSYHVPLGGENTRAPDQNSST